MNQFQVETEGRRILNERKTCANPKCFHLRHKLEKYCMHCRQRSQRYGHPNHRKITVSDLAEELQVAKQVIQGNRSKLLVVDCLTRTETELVRCWNAQSNSKFSERFWRLREDGYTAFNLLELAVATYSLSYRPMQGKILDDKHLTYMVGQFILGLSFKSADISGPMRREVGKWWIREFAVVTLLLAKVVRLVIDGDESQQSKNKYEIDAELLVCCQSCGATVRLTTYDERVRAYDKERKRLEKLR